MSHVLYSSVEQLGAPDAHVLAPEWDDLSAARVRDEFYAPTAGYEALTTAGLPMRFLQARPFGAGTLSLHERD